MADRVLGLSLRRPMIVALVASVSLLSRAGLAADPEVRDIGSRRELFVDRWLIDSLNGVELRLHPAVPREVALELNQPWAGPTVGFTAVMQDGDLYRFYYSDDGYGNKRLDATSYAESRDGIHWTTPNLGLFEYEGSKENNIVWIGKSMHNFNPFRDDNPDALPEERYKALGGGPCRLFASPDAIHWKQISPEPVLTDGYDDSQNLVFWDGLRKRYVAYARFFAPDDSGKPNMIRHIRTAFSPDFRQWPKTEPIIFPEGTPKEHLYTNAISPYFRAPHIYLGFPMRFHPTRVIKTDHPYPGVSDGVVISSRDGLHFDRTFLESFIRPDVGIENWTDRTNLPAWGVVQTGPAELSVYWVEHFKHPTVRLRRGTVRLDGFASIHAPPSGGEFVTRPLTFQGERLTINFQTSAVGSVRVAILEADGREASGFDLENCPEIFGNEIERTVSWTSGADVSRFAGRPIRLKFVLSDADLYALQFVP